MRFLYFLFTLLPLLANSLFAQTQNQIFLTGTIKSEATGEAIPRASIGILGTQNGTIANKEGRFSIALEVGKTYNLRIRAIGYKPDTISVTLNSSQERFITLSVEPIIGKEIVVSSDASRIEARRIMHEVIRRKKEWQSKLNDYKCTTYSRWNLRTLSGGDTTVQSVLESTADCFWKKDKGFSETITARKQTANFPPELNVFSVGDILNFYENRIEFNDLSLVGPVADDAFGSYDYDLSGTGMLNGASVYQISVEPDMMTQGFQGTVWIDQTDYTIAYLDLSPSKSVKIGPVKEAHFQQTFELFENNCYLPVELRTNVGIKFQLPLLPQINFELLSVLQNYSINKGIDDSLFGTLRHRISPQADSVDPTKWTSRRLIPLAADEEKAYHRIDSTVSEAQKDSSGGFSIFDVLSIIDLPRNDPIEGWRFGLSKSITPVRSFPLTLSGAIAYGLTDKLWKYELGFKQGILWTTKSEMRVTGDLGGGLKGKYVSEPIVLLAIEAKYFDDLSALRTDYNSVENTIASLINNDNQGFYYEKGFEGALDLTPDPGTSGSLFYRHTLIRNAGDLFLVNADSSNTLRHTSAAGLSLDKDFSFGKLTLFGSARFEIASKQMGSDYTYSEIQLKLTSKEKLGTLGELEIIGRYSVLLAGELPLWNIFFFETRIGFFSLPTYFRGLDGFEFEGNRLWSFNLEHNFFDLPTRLLGIHFLDQFDLHWLLHAGIGAIDVAGKPSYNVPTTAGIPYGEIGMGIGNIFNILQIEGTWRLTHRKPSGNFYPTLSLQFSF